MSQTENILTVPEWDPTVPPIIPEEDKDFAYPVVNEEGGYTGAWIDSRDNGFYICHITNDVYEKNEKGELITRYGYLDEDQNNIVRFTESKPIEPLDPTSENYVVDENGDIRQKKSDGSVCGTVIGKVLSDGRWIRIPIGATVDSEGNIIPPEDTDDDNNNTEVIDPTPPPPPAPKDEEIGLEPVEDRPEDVIDLGFTFDEINSIPWQKNQNIVTARSGDEYRSMEVGKYVITPWDKIYKIKERVNYTHGTEDGKFYEQVNNPDYANLPEDENGNKIMPTEEIEVEITNDETGEVTTEKRTQTIFIPEKINGTKLLFDYGPYLEKLDVPQQQIYQDTKYACILTLEYVREMVRDLSHLEAIEIDLPIVDDITPADVCGIYFTCDKNIDRDTFEMDIPSGTSARIDIWSVPICDSTPNGYFIAVNKLWASEKNIVEPGCATWEKKLLLRIRFESSTKYKSGMAYYIEEKDEGITLDYQKLAGMGYPVVLSDMPYQTNN